MSYGEELCKSTPSLFSFLLPACALHFCKSFWWRCDRFQFGYHTVVNETVLNKSSTGPSPSPAILPPSPHTWEWLWRDLGGDAFGLHNQHWSVHSQCRICPVLSKLTNPDGIWLLLMDEVYFNSKSINRKWIGKKPRFSFFLSFY